ncbi:MAG: hypothetical protein AAGJ32_13260 [Pseudomonadota bacterium]
MRGSTIAMADGNMGSFSGDTPVKDTPVITKASLRAAVLGIFCFVLVGVGVSTLYRANTPMPEIAVLSEKVEDYAQRDTTPDIVFLGSSQTFRHINPAIVDQTLAACGIVAESYNFGVPALRHPELEYIAGQVLTAAERPRLVVVQNPIRAETVFSNMMSERGRHFRGGAFTDAALEDVRCYTGTRMGQARSFLNTLRAMAAEFLGLGRLASVTVPTDPAPPPAYNEAYRSNAGFFPVEHDGNGHIVDRLAFSPMTDGIIAAGLAGEGYMPSTSVAACRARQLTDLFDRFRGAGLGVAYLVSPAPLDIAHDAVITDAVAAANPDMAVLDFNSAEAAETYFQRSLWYDAAHMTGEGADRLSQAVGAQLCTVLDR